jgi:hypothetical protein
LFERYQVYTKKSFATSFCKMLYEVGDSGLEPPTPSLSSNGTHGASEAPQGLAPTHSPVCTRVCTSEGKLDNAATLDAILSGLSLQPADALNADQGHESEGAGRGSSVGDPLAKLAAALLALSPADRARLAAMLSGQQGERLVEADHDDGGRPRRRSEQSQAGV